MDAPDRTKAERFLCVLAPGSDRFTFQTFTDSKQAREAGGKRDPLARVLHGTLSEHWDALARLSVAGAGVYVTANETNLRGRASADIIRVRSHFVDLDGAPLSNLMRLGLRPHLISQTSPGKFHVYWRVEGVRLDQFKDTQRRLAKLLGGDPNVCDLPRVMRLPGFPHQKQRDQPFCVDLAAYKDFPGYRDAEFRDDLAAAEAELPSGIHRRSVIADAVAGISQPPDMEQGYPDGERTRELTRRAGWCVGPANMSEQEADAACLAWNRHNNPPLPEEKVHTTVASIARAEARKRAAPIATTEEVADGREPTQREKLIVIGLDADLWHDKDGNVFATVTVGDHKESCAISSRAFRNWLTRTYGERYPMKVGGKTCPSAPSNQALIEAINALSAKAASGAEHQAAVRLGELGGLIYLDLGTPEWSAVEVSATGWRVIPYAPVRFIRPAGLRPLVPPIAGGLVSEMHNFLNVGSDADFILIVSWLIACLRPKGPYPVLVINGEHGSGKSVACRILRRLIDPNGAELRNESRDERDLMLAAKNGWIIALDNLSYVRNDLSDCICRIATKGAFATRTLYTNDEEFLLEVCRPVLLNGIPPLVSRADLSDRAIVCVLPTMADATRRTEEEFWLAFEDATPRLLGALLDCASGAMRTYASVRLQHSYRMMDFAKRSEAAWQALGYPPGTFETAYRQNRSNATEEAVDADPVAGALIDLMNNRQEFIGTATELLTQLERHVLPTQRDRRWPKDATRLSNQLRRLPPLLRPRGFEIYFDRSADAARKRVIVIKRVA